MMTSGIENIVKGLVAAILLFAPNIGFAQNYSSEIDPAIPAEGFCDQELIERLGYPFKSQEAIINFIQYVLKNGKGEIEIPDDFEVVAPRVQTWEYEMKRAPDGENCEMIYTQVIDLDELFRDLERAIYQVRREGCSFFSVRRVSVGLSGLKRVRGVGTVSGKKRTCFHVPFVGEVKTDLGDIEGTVTATIDFRTQPGEEGGRFRGEVFAEEPVTSQEIKVGDLLGIDLNSSVGKALNFLLGGITGVLIVDAVEDSIVDEVNDAVSIAIRRFSQLLAESTYLDETGGLVAFDKYIEFLNDTHQIVFSTVTVFNLDKNSTRLEMLRGKPALQVVFRGNVNWDVSRTTWASVQQEMRIIDSFDAPPKNRIVVADDNLWTIALQEYGSGFYKGPLAAYNQIPAASMDMLALNQELIIPPFHELIGLSGVKFFAPGETPYTFCLEDVGFLSVIECLRELATANAGLDLNKVHVMEPLVIPASLATP